MDWDRLPNSAINDMLRDEMIKHWIDDANDCYKSHRRTAGILAEAGDHEAAMEELKQANVYRRRAAMWQAELMKAEGATS